MSRTPPSLEYLVIYNKNLPAPPDVSKDDDDAQEEAHILFYTCRPGGVKRDKMLRQVGLAKALISFSMTFTDGRAEACEVVRSARTKLIMFSPEKDYWLLACVNVAFTERKEKDGASKKEYHESSVHDSALRTAISRAYHEFKLLHGTFSLLLSKSRASLERHLERFFTEWAWKWDIEQPPDFVRHLGTPQSAYTKHLTPLLDDVKPLLPERTPILLLSSDCILASSPDPASSLHSTTLPAHLMHHIPPYEAPPPPPVEQSSNSKNPTTKSSTGNRDGDGGNAVAQAQATGTNSTANFLPSMPKMKKWTGYFTFGGRSETSSPAPSAKEIFKDHPADPSANGTLKRPDIVSSTNSDVIDTTPSVNQEVDRQSLAEALEQADAPANGPLESSAVSEAVKDTTEPSGGTSHIPIVSPTLGYLTSAAGGLLEAMHFGSPKSKPIEDTKPSSSSSLASVSEGDTASPVPKPEVDEALTTPHVEVVNVDDKDDENDEEDEVKTDVSVEERGRREELTLAEKSLQKVLSRASSPAPRRQETVDLITNSTSDGISEPKEETRLRSSTVSTTHSEVDDDMMKSTATIRPSVKLLPPEAFFVPLSVYLEDEDTNELLIRRVYHMSFFGLMLAIIMPKNPEMPGDASIQSPASPISIITSRSRRFASSSYDDEEPAASTSTLGCASDTKRAVFEVIEGLGYPAYVDLPHGIEYKVVELLKAARAVLDRHEGERSHASTITKASSSGLFSTAAAPSSTHTALRNFAIVWDDKRNEGAEAEVGPVLATVDFNSTAGWLFENQAILRREDTILEQFSRTTTSQSWYISKRLPPSSGSRSSSNSASPLPASHATQRPRGDREIHLEICKESSLVDVDNDLASIVRRLEGLSSY